MNPVFLKSVSQNLPQCLKACSRLPVMCSELWENSTKEQSFLESHTLPLLVEGGPCPKPLLCFLQ